MEYFSEREGHLVPREKEDLSDAARDGIGALIRARVGSDAFAQSFPVRCHRCKESQVINTDERSFWAALEAVAPELGGWPRSLYLNRQLRNATSTTPFIFDVIEFCWAFVAEPQRIDASHPYDFLNTSIFDYKRGEHIHIQSNQAAGRRKFVEDIDGVFRRSGVAFTLIGEGRVERLLPAEFDTVVSEAEFHTGDAELNRLLNTARAKFLNPRLELRRESLEMLWDAWERLKTLGSGTKKSAQVKAMLDAAAGDDSPVLRQALERDARQLTDLGNELRIRHSEMDREMITLGEHLDYLFYRLFNLIWMILRTQKMVGAQI